MPDQIDAVLHEVGEELRRAYRAFPTGDHSAHESFAVFDEERDELWEAVKLNQRHPERARHIREEAIQAAAMAVRLIIGEDRRAQS